MANINDSNIAIKLINTPPEERLLYFLSIKDEIIDDSNYWQMLAATWISTDICSPYLKIWRDLFICYRRNRHKLMKGADRKIWRELTCRKAPEMVTVYRAMNDTDDVFTAISWTLDKKIADKLANGRKVIKWEIPKETIIAYFNRRGEKEVIHLWEEVKL